MWTEVSNERMMMTPKRAAEFLTFNTFEGQRAIRRDKVVRLAKTIQQGLWRRDNISLARAPSYPNNVLINGQHCCTACCETNTPIPVNLLMYHCPTDDDLWRLYSTFDVEGRRTDADILRGATRLLGNEELEGMPQRVLGSCISALSLIKDQRDPTFASDRMLTKIERIDLLKTYLADVRFISLLFNSETRTLMRNPVIVAMIMTRRANEPAAIEFWSHVLEADGLQRGSPQWQLHRSLARNFTSPGALGGGWPMWRRIYCVCITWWNAWRTGEKRTSVKVASMQRLPRPVR